MYGFQIIDRLSIRYRTQAHRLNVTQAREAKLAKMTPEQVRKFEDQERHTEWINLAKTAISDFSKLQTQLQPLTIEFNQHKKDNKWLPTAKLDACKMLMGKLEAT